MAFLRQERNCIRADFSLFGHDPYFNVGQVLHVQKCWRRFFNPLSIQEWGEGSRGWMKVMWMILNGIRLVRESLVQCMIAYIGTLFSISSPVAWINAYIANVISALGWTGLVYKNNKWIFLQERWRYGNITLWLGSKTKKKSNVGSRW